MKDPAKLSDPPAISHRVIFWLLFALHCSLRLGGLSWNIEHHSAFGSGTVPTYHVDEWNLIDALHEEYRPFNTGSIQADGPLSTNLLYLYSRVSGDPAARSSASLLRGGRLISAVADCLAFPVLWMLLQALTVSRWVSLFAVAALAVSPNNVFNAHFARSHVLANALQLVTVWASASALKASTPLPRAGWFALAVVAPILAGSARYPMLSLGIFPLVVGIILAVREWRVRDPSFFLVIGSGAAALVLGILFGFKFHPIAILKEGYSVQSSIGFGWISVDAIARSAFWKVASTLQFPGGVLQGLMLALAMGGFLIGLSRGERGVVAWLCALMAGWTLFYLLLWAKFSVPWQRYSIAFMAFINILGIVGMDRLWKLAKLHSAPGFSSIAARALAAVAALILLSSSARMTGLIIDRYIDDASHPLFQLSEYMAEILPSGRPQVFVSNGWSWNSPVLRDLIPKAKFDLRFVNDIASACNRAKAGDLLLDLQWSRLGKDCPAGGQFTDVFYASNVGPVGFPYPANADTEVWAHRYYEDYHYLFQTTILRRFDASR